MTITIDCRHLDSSGIGVYLRGCLPFFLNSANNFYLLGNPEKIKPQIQGRVNVEILECNVKPFSVREFFFFPRKLLSKINSTDSYFTPFFNVPPGIRIPVFTTIHDIIFPDMPELTSRAGLALRMWFYRRAFAKSKKIFTVSEFSKSRIEYYSRGKVDVIVTCNSVQPELPQWKKNGIVKKNTIIFIGNIKKHKGLDCLLEAFLLVRRENKDARLVIIGSRDNFRTRDNLFLKKIDSIGNDGVLFTGFVSDRQLADHLAEASLLVQPSLYEGFGIPPLEAMFLGTRALVSNIPVFREIYGDFPVTFFHAGDPVDLKEKILCLLADKNTGISLSKNLLTKYTYEKTASIIMKHLV